jgi:DNA polymerase elongation subunit (family B)
MYKNVYYDRDNNEVIVWDDKKGRLAFKYKKYAYIKAPNGKFTALDGNKVEKIYNWDKEDETRKIIYESDVKAETRILIDNYGDTDDISENITTLFFDIEVAKGSGYSTPWDANNEVTAITLYDNVSKNWNVLLLDKEHLTKNKKTDEYILEAFSSEKELLMRFFQIYLEIQPDILTGWNIDGFDVPYIYHRTKKLLGANIAKQLSPVGVVQKDFRKDRMNISGVSALDYMYLYKAFTYNEEPSYALEFISQKELGRGKTVYDGDLDNLYKTDLDLFITYNINDVKLVVDLDEKLEFITLARNIAHKGHVPYEDVFASSRYLDGACLTYLNRLGIISTNKPARDNDSDDDVPEQFEGAFVKDPKPGLYEWVFDLDLKALYPSTQRTVNISPETKICKIENWDHKKFMEDNLEYTYKYKSKSWKGLELRKFLEEHNYSVSAVGVIYDLKSKGLIPSILENWDAERTEYRQLAKKYAESGNEKMYRFFDSRQLTMKILSNSLYGVLGNAGFRFYDIDNAEGTTLGGKSVIMHKTSYINKWLNEKLGTSNIDYVIYIDTDSCFLSALPLIKKMQRNENRTLSKEECANVTFKLAVACETIINSTFDEFARVAFNANTHHFQTKQEYVSETAIWIAKKRYAQKIISEKGVSIKDMTGGKKEYKLDVKGLDVVRSSFPKAFRGFMSGIILDILNKANKQDIVDKIFNLKTSLPDIEIYDIMTISGIKELSKYQCKNTNSIFKTRPKGMPIHAKSAANYNDLLEHFKITYLAPISDGDKIKWTYLKPNRLGIETLALTGFNDPPEIYSILKENIDFDCIFESSLENKLNDFFKALGWGKEVPKNNNGNKFFDFG